MRLNTRAILASFAILVFPLVAGAQTVATTTTLAAAVTATATTLSVTSATGFTVGNYVYLDAEAVQITSVSGTSIGVSRGQLGTATQAHANSERIITGGNGHFQSRDPNYGAACTKGDGDAAFQPFINVIGGRLWMCNASVWQATSTMSLTYNSIPSSF